jgi:hypothetical protein
MGIKIYEVFFTFLLFVANVALVCYLFYHLLKAIWVAQIKVKWKEYKFKKTTKQKIRRRVSMGKFVLTMLKVVRDKRAEKAEKVE